MGWNATKVVQNHKLKQTNKKLPMPYPNFAIVAFMVFIVKA